MEQECGAVYVSNPLGGMDICRRPHGHKGAHDWRKDTNKPKFQN